MTGLATGLARSVARAVGRGVPLNPATGAPAYSPTSLFAGGEEGFFFDVSDLSTVWEDSAGTVPASVDGPVGRVTDKSGRSRNITQGTTASKPTLRQAGALYYLEFDGVDDSMPTASFACVGAGPHSAGASVRPATVAAGGRRIIESDSGTPANRCGQFLKISAAVPEAAAYNTVPTQFTDTNPAVTAGVDIVMAEVTNASAIQLWVNNVSNGATTITGTLQTATNPVRIGARYDGAAERFSGRLYSAVLLARAMTAGERTDLQTFLGTKAGIVV